MGIVARQVDRHGLLLPSPRPSVATENKKGRTFGPGPFGSVASLGTKSLVPRFVWFSFPLLALALAFMRLSLMLLSLVRFMHLARLGLPLPRLLHLVRRLSGRHIRSRRRFVICRRLVLVPGLAAAWLARRRSFRCPRLPLECLCVSLSRTGRTSCFHARATEHSRMRRCRYGRLPVIGGRKHRPIRARLALMMHLHFGRLEVAFSRSCQLSRRRPGRHASRATVVCCADHRPLVHHRPFIHVVYDVHIYVGYRSVVIELSPAPVSARIPDSCVPVPVVDSAIKAHVRTPVSPVPRIYAAGPAPVARRPQQPYGRWQYPCAGHPVVPSRAVCPVARCPDVTGPRNHRLCVHRQCWRPHSYRYNHLCLRRPSHGQDQQRKY